MHGHSVHRLNRSSYFPIRTFFKIQKFIYSNWNIPRSKMFSKNKIVLLEQFGDGAEFRWKWFSATKTSGSE